MSHEASNDDRCIRGTARFVLQPSHADISGGRARAQQAADPAARVTVGPLDPSRTLIHLLTGKN
jgi:hypothetical protein